MGLSDSERVEQFYLGMGEFVFRLNMLKEFYKDTGRTYNSKVFYRYIDKYISMAQETVGRMVSSIESSAAYWVLGNGSNDLNFYAIRSSPVLLGSSVHDGAVCCDNATLWFDDNISLIRFSDVIEHEQRDLVRLLSRWWHVQDKLPAILYVVNRYDDDLFSRVKKALYRMTGAFMVDRVPFLRSVTYARSTEHLLDVEKELLCRFNVYRELCHKEYIRLLEAGDVDADGIPVIGSKVAEIFNVVVSMSLQDLECCGTVIGYGEGG